MERMKGRTGYMIIKIDLEKTYDRLEWGFVRNMLASLNFHMDTVNLVLSCISTTSVSLLFNGEQLDEFQPSRGLRQGDPISPYIFILCMEFLSALINKKCEEGVWGRVKALRNGPGFSHIFFTDDLLLFAKATQENCEAIFEVLEEFCSATGLKISREKPKVFFSPTVSTEDRVNLTNQLDICETNNLGNYLGFPLRHKGRNRNEFLFIIDRVQAKLAGWKSNCLSPVGRLVLLKAVVTPIVEYFMQCCKLPIRVSERIDKLTRDFLWGSNDERQRMHMVGWDKVTNPTCIGGLGLFQVKARNDAILAKLCWRIASNLDAAWILEEVIGEHPSPQTMFSFMEMLKSLAPFFTAAVVVILSPFAKERIPVEVSNYLVSAFKRWLARFATPQVTVVIEEKGDLTSNQVYKAVKAYLRTLICDSTKPRRFKFRTEKEEGPGSKKYFELPFDKGYEMDVLKSYLADIVDSYERIQNTENVVKIYTCNEKVRGSASRDHDRDRNVHWSSVSLEHPATFEKLAMNPEQKKMLKDDLDRFLGGRDIYEKVGEAWKGGYLLYGPPGTVNQA
nr:aaa-atpase [Quercus suber]